MNAVDVAHVVEHVVQVVIYVVIEQKNAWTHAVTPSLNVVIVQVKIVNAIVEIVEKVV